MNRTRTRSLEPTCAPTRHTRRRELGVTLVELVIVVAVMGVLVAVAVPGFRGWQANERVKAAARSVSDAMYLARSEAIRTGDNHLVVLGMALGAPTPVVVVDDGPPATANCSIDAGEVLHRVPPQFDVSWGTSTGAANGTLAPEDGGNVPANASAGFTFSDGGGSTPASWVLFQSDGIPRTFTSTGAACSAIGAAGDGGGGVYITNGTRDYSIVLRPLGIPSVHRWQPGGGWSS